LKVRTGCSGWSYKQWVGTFYPLKAKPKDYLRLYSAAFDCVEVDSSFYRIPSQKSVYYWAGSTPSDFIFTVKMPKQITHEGGFIGYERLLEHFLKSISVIRGKMGPILIQLPPSLTYEKDWELLKAFLDSLTGEFKYAIEFRHQSFFQQNVYSKLESHKMTLVWSDLPYLEPEPVITSDTLYLRLVGDRSIDESEFGTIAEDKSNSIAEWVARIRFVQENVEKVFIFSNNHYQGFGPATVNIVRKELGLPEINWSTMMKASVSEGQATLFDTI
jgi:uncharacterized protein YecE (DUF72 family)